MDQKSLYELQFNAVKVQENSKSNKLINTRDDFIIEYLNILCREKNIELNIAELSIGDGKLSRELLYQLSEVNLTCVDISDTRIMNAKKLIHDSIPQSKKERVSFYSCNFDTDFNILKNSSFNVVIALDIMEHVFDVFGFVENCYRILQEEGVLLIRVPNVAYIKHRLGLICGNLPITASWFGIKGDLTGWRNWGWDGGHLHYFTIPLLYKLLMGAGFQIKSCHDPGTKFTLIRNIYPQLLYGNPLIIAYKKTN